MKNTVNPVPQMGYYNIENAGGNIIGRALDERTAKRFAASDCLLAALENLWGVCDANNYEVPLGVRNQIFEAVLDARGPRNDCNAAGEPGFFDACDVFHKEAGHEGPR